MTEIDRPRVWSDVDTYLTQRRDHLFLSGRYSSSEVWLFHGGCVSAVIDLPPFVLEDAERLTDAVVDLVPQLAPGSILMLVPYLADVGDDLFHAIRVLRWARDGGWRIQLWPTMPLHGQPLEGPIDVEPDGPYVSRLITMSDAPSRMPTGVFDTTWLPRDVVLSVAPDGPLAGSTPLFGRRRRGSRRTRRPRSRARSIHQR